MFNVYKLYNIYIMYVAHKYFIVSGAYILKITANNFV